MSKWSYAKLVIHYLDTYGRAVWRWLQRHPWWAFLLISVLTLLSWSLFFWAIIHAGVPPKVAATWTFVVVWFLHLLVGAGAGYAAWRLWPERDNRFIKYTMVHLCAAIVDALGGIVLVFVARGLRWTWAFSIVFFAAVFLRDLLRVPLMLYVIRGPKDSPQASEPVSGDMPKEFWIDQTSKVIEATIRRMFKPEFLK